MLANRANELKMEVGTDIHLFSFEEWVEYEIGTQPESIKDAIAFRWLTAVVESFAQKRTAVAPIDEPCDAWMTDLIRLLMRE